MLDELANTRACGLHLGIRHETRAKAVDQVQRPVGQSQKAGCGTGNVRVIDLEVDVDDDGTGIEPLQFCRTHLALTLGNLARDSSTLFGGEFGTHQRSFLTTVLTRSLGSLGVLTGLCDGCVSRVEFGVRCRKGGCVVLDLILGCCFGHEWLRCVGSCWAHSVTLAARSDCECVPVCRVFRISARRQGDPPNQIEKLGFTLCLCIFEYR